MKRIFLFMTSFAVISLLDGNTYADELRSTVWHYDYGIGKDGAIDEQHVICAGCPPRPRLSQPLRPPVPLVSLVVPNKVPKPVEVSAKPTPIAPLRQTGFRTAAIVRFRLNESNLDKLDKYKLTRVAKEIKSLEPLPKVSAMGYTCDLGPEKYNDKLATRRAKAVASFLARLGINVSTVTGKGKCCYETLDPKKRGQNRRAAVLIWDRELTEDIDNISTNEE